MGKRAAVAFSVVAVVLVLQWFASDAQPPQQFYMVAPPMPSQLPRAGSPQMMASGKTLADTWDYEVAFDSEDVQRRVMERLFRKAPPAPAMADPSEDVALQMAAREVREIARTFGRPEGDFADKWVTRVMATEDPKARLVILDECFIDLTPRMDCQGLEDALRHFRMLLAPHTAVVTNAKQQVRTLAAKFDAPKQRFVEAWMKKVEHGQPAEDPGEVLDECLISTSMGGARSRDCFDFEDALRTYKSAADLWVFQI
jgi:hypothetical protein